MSYWKVVWDTYHAEATHLKIFLGIWDLTSLWERFYTLALVVIFLLSLILFFILQGWLLIPVLLAEAALIMKFTSLSEKMVYAEFGDQEAKQPLKSQNHQDTRYLMFKKKLKESSIGEPTIRECFELLDSQIDIVATESAATKKIITFSLGLLAGLVGSVWNRMEYTELALVAGAIISFILLIYVVASGFPSKLEKLKELRYFMLLYCHEASITNCARRTAFSRRLAPR
jgi:cytochrome c oxidase subunit IV